MPSVFYLEFDSSCYIQMNNNDVASVVYGLVLAYREELVHFYSGNESERNLWAASFALICDPVLS